MTAFYNEHDPKAAAWLRELIARGEIADGVVDERSISDISPDELAGFTQCHFFAGIGVWPLALRTAGWADDRPIWSGSCPCQPFSAAGKGDGFADERHLFPDWHWLIKQRRPSVVVGEQVASKDGLVWLDLVSTDLEGTGYAFGAADLCAAGAGLEAFSESVWGERLSRAIHLCPDPVVARALDLFADFAAQHLGGEHGGAHIRQRSYFVGLADIEIGGLGELGDALGSRQGGHADRSGDASGGMAHCIDDGQRQYGERLGDAPGARESGPRERERLRADLTDGFATSRLPDTADDHGRRGERGAEAGTRPNGEWRRGFAGSGSNSGLGHADSARTAPRLSEPAQRQGWDSEDPDDGSDRRARSGSGRSLDDRAAGADAPNRRRGDADWLLCRDDRWRPVEPGTFPLAHAAPARVGRLRGYGNALDFETALLWV